MIKLQICKLSYAEYTLNTYTVIAEYILGHTDRIFQLRTPVGRKGYSCIIRTNNLVIVGSTYVQRGENPRVDLDTGQNKKREREREERDVVPCIPRHGRKDEAPEVTDNMF